jgi:hypothetical protein
MLFEQVSKDVFYCFRNGRSFWIKEHDGKFNASMWQVLPTALPKPICEQKFDSKIDAEKYLITEAQTHE